MVTHMLPLAAIGTTEWLLIICACALLFGAKKIPELARSLGSSVNEFKKGMKEGAEPTSPAAPSEKKEG